MSTFGNAYLKYLAKKSITIVVVWNVVMLCLFMTFSGFIFFIVAMVIGAASSAEAAPVSSYSTIYGTGTGTNQLLSIPIKGVITGSDPGNSGLFGSIDTQTAGYSVKEELYRAADDDMVKGIILEIDSPGGTIYGAHAIADGVAYFRNTTKRPVYAHISGTGASGAYWAAVSTDKILVDYGSDVGSVGVIMGPFEYYDKPLSQDNGLLGGGVLTQNGIETVTITAGRSKDVGNPYRRLTGAEIAELQRQINNEYDDFVGYVSQRRNLAADVIRNEIGAMTYDQKSAKNLGLSDATMSREDAYQALAKAAKVGNDYVIVQDEQSYGFVESLLMATGVKPRPQVKAADLCTLSHASLAYHGDVSSWCQK